MTIEHTDLNGTEVSRLLAQVFIAQLRPEDVVVVYSGKQGCMCGCKGNYRVNPDRVEEAREVTGTTDQNRAQVARVLAKLKAQAHRCAVQDGTIVHVADALIEDGERNLVVYVSRERGLDASGCEWNEGALQAQRLADAAVAS